MSKDTGGPAFPTKNYKAVVPEATGYAEGMTLRDYFAAKAMQGLLAQPGLIKVDDDANLAYKMADAMLRVREA
jgi:hypothetical protein